MRDSAWRITWDPAGESPRVLLEFGDPMDDEIARTLAQVVDVGRFDQATNGKPYGRGNRKRRLSLTRTLDFSSASGAWQAMLGAMTSDPWASKALLRIQPRLGGSIFCRAALLGISRRPETQPWPGYSESVALRVDGGLTLSGSPLTVTGGWYNPPVVGGGTASGGITVVIVGTDTGLNPGDVVKVTGATGIRDGAYTVTGVRTSGGNTQVDIDAASKQLPRIDAGDVVGGSASGAVNLAFDGAVYLDGMIDSATYELTTPGGGTVGVSPDSYGRDEIDLGEILSQIGYNAWYTGGGPPHASVDPLPIDGQSHGYPGGTATETGPTGWTVALKRNGDEIDSHTVAVSWKSAKTYSAGGPANHTLSSGREVAFSLHGPATTGVARRDTGVPVPITAGTVQKLS